MSYPGAVRDPDTGEWISDAEVAETSYTAFASTPHTLTARLIVRRVKDASHLNALFPVWRYHPFRTDTDDPAPEADIARVVVRGAGTTTGAPKSERSRRTLPMPADVMACFASAERTAEARKAGARPDMD